MQTSDDEEDAADDDDEAEVPECSLNENDQDSDDGSFSLRGPRTLDEAHLKARKAQMVQIEREEMEQRVRDDYRRMALNETAGVETRKSHLLWEEKVGNHDNTVVMEEHLTALAALFKKKEANNSNTKEAGR